MNYLEHAYYYSDRGNTDMVSFVDNLGIELPQTGIVLDIGSGSEALIERQAALTHPDLTIIALDPNLYSATYRKIYMTEDFGLPNLGPAESVVAIAGLSQHLPFRTNSFDLVVSHAGVPTYLPLYPKSESEEGFALTFSEINRVLKPGARAVMGPMEEPAYARSEDVLKSMGFIFTGEEIPVQHYSISHDPWFRISFEKQ